ncbi:MAG: hypothetical protein A3G93_04820 [Nitrospinae bacterium RIFCSPLOWO2_12_FULL_45_22]|nr:MAG: hypothetical protein A3G93_04820 [Nitrospinae bacterium RIFCSPLOWO2_12_FULL_45_22]
MDKEKALILYRAGKGIKAIAKELNTYPNAIKRVLVKMGTYKDRVTTTSNQGDNQVTHATPPCNPSRNQTVIEQYRKDFCKNSDTCSVCNLESDKLKLLEELYIAGTPSPVLHNYFNITSKDLGYHAYYRNWHHKKARWEDPKRKKAVQAALETEAWRTIMASEVGGDAGDRIAAMKLAAQLSGLGEAEKREGMGPGVLVKMRLTLNNPGQQKNAIEVGKENSEMLVDLDEEYEEEYQ